MICEKLTIKNKLGLHARASALLSDTAIKFTSKIVMHHNGREIDLKSILDVMTSGGVKGNEVEVCADGPDEEKALATIADLFNHKFNEKE